MHFLNKNPTCYVVIRTGSAKKNLPWDKAGAKPAGKSSGERADLQLPTQARGPTARVFLVSFLLPEFWSILLSFLPKPWLHSPKGNEALAKYPKNFLVQIMQCNNSGIHCDINIYISSDISNICHTGFRGPYLCQRRSQFRKNLCFSEVQILGKCDAVNISKNN